MEGENMDGNSSYKWHASRLELDWESACDDKKLSGQIRQTAARELYYLTANPPPSLRSDALRRLHFHLKRLYLGGRKDVDDKARALPTLHDETKSNATWTPVLPVHPAFPILFGVSDISTPVSGVASTGPAEAIRMAFRHHSHSLRSGLALERHRLLRLPDVPGYAQIDPAAASDLQVRFLLYQLLKAVAHIHGDDDDNDSSDSKSGSGSNGGAFGGVGLAACDIRLTGHHWLVLVPAVAPAMLWPSSTSTSAIQESTLESSTPAASSLASAPTPQPTLAAHQAEMVVAQMGTTGLEPKVPRPIDWGVPITEQWCQGRLSNLDYLLWLNRAVGRSTCDAKLHAVVPWVSDCVTPWSGWRDLGQSKRRLKSGDQALDLSYAHSSPPHHIAEGLSELAYYMYEARRVPLATLRATVRSNFVAAQYPVSIARLIAWTPDEATPAFYSDPALLRSRHKELGLADLEVPPFVVEMAEEKFGGDRATAFISYHRALLESPQVSRHLHRWIDLVFGCNLLGPAARRHRNVPLAPPRHVKNLETCASMGSDVVDDRGSISSSGGWGLGAGGQPVAAAVQRLEQRPRLVALFDTPHPPRRSAFVEARGAQHGDRGVGGSYTGGDALGSTLDSRNSNSSSSSSSSSSGADGEVYSAAAAARDLHAVGAAQAQQEYHSWLKLSATSSSSTDFVGSSPSPIVRDRRNATPPHAPSSQRTSQTPPSASATPPLPPGSHPSQPRHGPQTSTTPLSNAVQPPNPLALGLESALGGDLLDNLGALFGPGLNAEGNQPDPRSRSSSKMHDSGSDQSLMNRNQIKTSAAAVSSTSGWQVNRVQDWAIQAAMAPEVRSADQAALDRYAHTKNAALAASCRSGNGNHSPRKTRPPTATSGQIQESKADDLLMRFLPRIQMSECPTRASAQSDCLTQALTETDGSNSVNLDKAGAPALTAAPGGRVLERGVDVVTNELESRMAFAKLHDSTIDGGQKLLEHRARVRASQLSNAAVRGSSVSKHPSEECDRSSGDANNNSCVGDTEKEHLSTKQALALLRADDALACGLLLAELATGKPALSSARVEEAQECAATGRSDGRVDLRACLEPSVDALPAPVVAAVRALLHPNPHCRPTPRTLLAMAEGATLSHVPPRASSRKNQNATPVDSRNVCTNIPALKRQFDFNDGCLGDIFVYDPFSNSSQQLDHGAALKALFPSYFSVLYDYMREVSSQAQAADLADMSFHTIAKTSSSHAATTAAATTASAVAQGCTSEGTSGEALGTAAATAETATAAAAGAAITRDNMVGASSLAMLVTTLEALPKLVTLPPPAFAMVLPYVLHAVFGSTTPYIYAYEHMRQRRLEREAAEISSDDDDDDDAEKQQQLEGTNRSDHDFSSADGSPSSVDALLLRARLCATAPQKQLGSGDEGASCLVLHIPAAMAMVGAAVGLPAAQALFSTRVVAFLEAATQHPPALLLPLLRQAVASSPSSVKGREHDSSSGDGGQPLSIWSAMCRTCGWSTLRLHLIPQAIRWLEPANVVLNEAAAHAEALSAIRAAKTMADSTTAADGVDDGEDYFETSSPRDLIRASTEVPLASARVLATLVAPNALGPMLAMRHILAPLLDMLGKIQRTSPSSPVSSRKVADAITSVFLAISEVEGGSSRLVFPAAQLVATAALSRAPTGAFSSLMPALKQRAAPAAAYAAFKTTVASNSSNPIASSSHCIGASLTSVASPSLLHVASMTALCAASELIAVLRGLLIPQLSTPVVLELYFGGATLKRGKSSSSSQHSSASGVGPGSEDTKARLSSTTPTTKSSSDHANASPGRKQEPKDLPGDLHSVGDLLIALLPSPALVAERAAYEIAEDGLNVNNNISEGAGEAARAAAVHAASVERAHVARAEKEALRDASALVAEVALHLMVSAKAATVESVVLPLVNRFFAAFDSVYGLLLQNHASTAGKDESGQVAVALTLARGLYLPIASLVGFDAMTEGVPSASRVRQSIHGTSSGTSSSSLSLESNLAVTNGGGRVGGSGAGGDGESGNQHRGSGVRHSGLHGWGDLFGGQQDRASELNLVDKGLKWFKKQKDKIGGREHRQDKTKSSRSHHNAEGSGHKQWQDADDDAAWFVRETMLSRGSSLQQLEYSLDDGGDFYRGDASHRQRTTAIATAATLTAPQTPVAVAPASATTIQTAPLEVVENFFEASATRRLRKLSSGSGDASENDSQEGGYTEDDDKAALGEEDEPNPFLGEDSDIDEEEDEGEEEEEEDGNDDLKERTERLNEANSDDVLIHASTSSSSSQLLATSLELTSKSSSNDLAASFDEMGSEGASMELGALPDRRRTSSPAAAAASPPTLAKSSSSSQGRTAGMNDVSCLEGLKLRFARGRGAGKRIACVQPCLDFQRVGRLLPLLFVPRCQVASVLDLNPTSLRASSRALFEAMVGVGSNSSSGRVQSGNNSSSSGSGSGNSGAPSLTPPGELSKSLSSSSSLHESPGSAMPQRAANPKPTAAHGIAPPAAAIPTAAATSSAAPSTASAEGGAHSRSSHAGAGDASQDGGIRIMVTDAMETTLITGHRGGAITVWSLHNLPELTPRCSYRAHGDGVVAAVLFGNTSCSTGHTVAPLAASCDLEGALHVWDTETATTLDAWRSGFSHGAARESRRVARASGRDPGPAPAMRWAGASHLGGGGGGCGKGYPSSGSSRSGSSSSGAGSGSLGSSHHGSSSSSGGGGASASVLAARAAGCAQGSAGPLDRLHAASAVGPYVALADLGAHYDLEPRPADWRPPRDARFGGHNTSDDEGDDNDGDDDVDEDEKWLSELGMGANPAVWVKSPGWSTPHQLLAATPGMLHLFDLRCPRDSTTNSVSRDSSGGGQLRVELLPRAEWALSPSPLIDLDLQDPFKGPGLRCVAAGRADVAGGLDPYLYAGSGTGRAWVVDRRNGRVLFDWQAHGGGAEGSGGSAGGGSSTGSKVGSGSGMGNPWDGLGGSAHGGIGGGSSSGSGGGLGGVGSGGSMAGGGGVGLGNAFHDARGLNSAVLAVRPGAARHSCVTVSYDQSALVWDLSGATPRCVSSLKGLPSVSTAGVMGAHLHASTIHVHDFVTPSNNNKRSGDSAPAALPSNRQHQQVLYAAAGHKISIAALPSPGVSDTAVPRYFYDRGGHKIHRHQLTTKASVVLPLWRMVLLGGLDDKIRVCI